MNYKYSIVIEYEKKRDYLSCPLCQRQFEEDHEKYPEKRDEKSKNIMKPDIPWHAFHSRIGKKFFWEKEERPEIDKFGIKMKD